MDKLKNMIEVHQSAFPNLEYKKFYSEVIHNNYIKTYGGREKYFNLKDTKKDLVIDDCVIRAISIANSEPYNKVWEILCEQAILDGFFPNDDRVSEKVLKEYGWHKIKIAHRKLRTKTIYENYFDSPANAEDRFYILHIRGHWVAMSNNVFYDSWDSYSSNKIVYNIYEQMDQ
tara:strand:- start:1122 stop:1640 length:519 start_codon:yes stop_codon:yes gene_type:complete